MGPSLIFYLFWLSGCLASASGVFVLPEVALAAESSVPEMSIAVICIQKGKGGGDDTGHGCGKEDPWTGM